MRLGEWALLAAVSTAVFAADPVLPDDSLRPGVPVPIYLAPGRATTVQLQTGKTVAAISLASPLVTYRYDKALNELEITPAPRASRGETNLNLRIGPDVYVLLLRVVTDVRAQYLRRFVLAGEGDDEENALAEAHPLRPEDVDVVGAARAIERAERDPVFRAAHPELRVDPLDRCVPWNGCLVALREVAQFLDRDLLVFRVEWLNRTPDALYLDASQYGLQAAGHAIPIVARYQVGSGPVAYPGDLVVAYLAVQGYRLSRHNDWRLVLPPEAAAIERLTGGEGR